MYITLINNIPTYNNTLVVLQNYVQVTHNHYYRKSVRALYPTKKMSVFNVLEKTELNKEY